MELLTDKQKTMADTLLAWVQEHASGDVEDLLLPEDEFAHATGDMAWRRSLVDDLGVLCGYCSRRDIPMIPLVVVIPGFGKPEKALLIRAFKKTLPTAEANKLWQAELKAMKKAPKKTWKRLEAELHPADEAGA